MAPDPLRRFGAAPQVSKRQGLSGLGAKSDMFHSTRAADQSAPVNAFTVDVEDYFHVGAFASVIAPESWSERESRVERNTERLLALLEHHSIRATFFVLGWVAARYPNLVKGIASAGHEVACHGFSHRLIYRQNEKEFHEETARAKRILEDITGTPVLGYRAASFSIVRDSLWALDHLIDLGFAYDSSIFPIRHDRYGIPGASAEPGRIAAPSGRTLVEFPMSPARFLGVSVPVTGGGYFRLLPYRLIRAGLRQINRGDRPFAFYLHPWEIDPQQPRIAAPALSRFRHYTNLARCESRLARLLGEFRFGPMIEVLRMRELLPAHEVSEHGCSGIAGIPDRLESSDTRREKAGSSFIMDS